MRGASLTWRFAIIMPFNFPSHRDLHVEPPGLKRAAVGLLLIVASALWLVSCGGGNATSSSLGLTSGLSFRAFVSNSFTGQLDLIDATADTLDTHTIATNASLPSLMALTPDRSTTLVFCGGPHTMSVIDNSTEQSKGLIGLPDFTESFIPSADSGRAFAAVPNEGVFGQPNGAVDVLNIIGLFKITSIPVPGAHYLALSPDGSRLLAFGDNSNDVTVINTNRIGQSGVSTTVSGFDRPVAGIFSSDGTKAFILNCGLECGGTQAGMTVLNMSDNSVGQTVPLQAATVGLLNGTTLYVAGTPSGGAQGTLQTVDTGSLIAAAPIAISNGFHNRMALTGNLLFVGARTCSNVTSGCLSIVDTNAKTATMDTPNGDVTGMAPISNRNVIYVVEGGEVRIFDTTTGKLSPTQIDISGKAIDVIQVDAAK